MTNFEPYVAGKVRVGVSMVSYGRQSGKQQQRGGNQNQQQRGQAVARGPPPPPNKANSDSIESGGGIGAVFRKIRSSLSTAAGLQLQPQPAASRASLTASTASSSSTSGATKKPTSSAATARQGQQRQQQRPVTVARKQPRQQQQTNRPPPPRSKMAPQFSHHSSAPILHKHTKGDATKVTKVSPSRSSRATSPPVRGGPSSPTHRVFSPMVDEGMASFGPGSGRRNNPPPPQLLPSSKSTNHEQGPLSVMQSEQQKRSKSEEPPSSPQWAECDPPRALDDGFSKVSNNVRRQQVSSSSSGDAHQITLMSYSDVHKHRAAAVAAKTAGASKVATAGSSNSGRGGGGGGGGGGGAGVRPGGSGVKKPLNRQDLLKRIGSIENDEV